MSLDLPLDLEQLEAYIKGAPPEVKEKLAKIAAHQLEKPWLPQDGPQSDAFYSEADETLYGGAAGGGKTDLLIGLATTAHRRSLIFRNQSTDLGGFWERLTEVAKNPRATNDVKRRMITKDKRLIEGGHLGEPGSERNWQGRPHDLIGFDEAAQLQELRVNFVLQWLRSTEQGQRKRAVFATNPPIPEIGADGQMTDTGAGDWLIRWFAPWVDEHFHNPAAPGELRWCFMRAEGDRLVTVWVQGPGCYDPATGEHKPDATQEDIDKGRVSVARSRTFIKSLLSDNRFLSGTGYAERLSSTPEPLKSMLLNGDFTVRGEDHPRQVIPTEWILAAQERWKNRTTEDIVRLRQLVLYGDIAQGGADTTVLAPLCETDYFDELKTAPGSQTPTGKEVAKLILEERLDGSLIVLDATGGWAGATSAVLEERYRIECEMHTVSKVDGSWTPDMLYRYSNLRTKMWWEFRLALDPGSGYKICLPPGARLRVQLSAPHWNVKGKELHVESKDELRKRLGSSTDEADAVLGAWQYRDQALTQIMNPKHDLIEVINGREPDIKTPLRRAAHAQQQVDKDYDDYDPRGDW